MTNRESVRGWPRLAPGVFCFSQSVSFFLLTRLPVTVVLPCVCVPAPPGVFEREEFWKTGQNFTDFASADVALANLLVS